MRVLRRTFAASVVLITACKGKPPQSEESHNPPMPNPPGPVAEQKPSNPPPPELDPAHGHGEAPTTPPPPVVPTPGLVNPPPPQVNPPPPLQADNHDLHWMITKKDGKCTAFFSDACKVPGRKPGDPIPPCNPPIPTDYKCQPAITDATYKVVKREGATKCFLDYTCPANAKCTAPPELDCPR